MIRHLVFLLSQVPCNTMSCDRNCKLHRWTKFTMCSQACDGGYWLLRTRAEHAQHGYSSQDMAVFGKYGAVAVGRQCVAIYA